ncbi:antitoxin MazE-like protein [Mycobacteroides abscessus]|uniref:antitoxin MazE-like protein n=2 Tax=Mycobacteriaceae TaxID=1762 RepID=UPI00092A4D01|nr:Protein of uncharacterised function (DUF3018) [Mycobacteroides abscessus subsp. abscessus]SHU99315.1 Protein of uncharacterised function (DUF3018) [Mycobacteroides abscessus subsp. abscessus]SHV59606.1 Protein of uncharacterised function (DUF3018) [Mycobacteroides abscessus subsp. abscessus]SHV82559.1 Protein of uncharacterised function (DUF3018) [Mycobacteroides abscessus subsp. abscessus]SHW23261.1 Protein of uncharacterised function (DUF3018) [Mycobacteroides abscessus subsp. abscessus]
MSPMPEGWSVDVDGTRVVVRAPGGPGVGFYLDVAQARMLKKQLHLAYLIADHQRSDSGRDDDLGPIPAGWHIETVGRRVHFEVSASGVDGEFTLTPDEALVAGIALIRGSEQARSFDEPAGDDDTDSELSELLSRAATSVTIRRKRVRHTGDETAGDDDTRAPGFAEEAHRQSALVAAASSEAEDQAWVDDVSEFNDEGAALDSESESGEQE